MKRKLIDTSRGDYLGKLARAIASGNIDAAEMLVRKELDIPDPSVPVRRWVCFAVTGEGAERELGMDLKQGSFAPNLYVGPGDRGWSDESWFMWFRNRLSAHGHFRALENPPLVDSLPVTLHVFFIYLEETPEMLARLNRYEGKEKRKKLPGQSKIFTTNLKPVPIDRTAFNVAPPPKEAQP
jgi:hypothetical protein